MSGGRASRDGHIVGFDGMRAFAVMLVLISHVWLAVPELLGNSWFRVFPRGGFLGVNVFFVLSGFLITYRILDDRRSGIASSLRAFWAKRLTRIMPLTLVYLGSHLAYVKIWGTPVEYTMSHEWTGIASTIFQYANLAIYHDTKVLVDNVAIWSLSIEGQFYLFAPLFVLFILLRIRRSSLGLLLVGVVTVALAVNTARVYDASGWFAAYIRTDSRFSSLVLGMFGAMWWHHRPPRRRRVLQISSVLALGVIFAIIGWSRADGGFLWFGGMTLFDSAVLVVVLAAAVGACPISGFLDLPPLRWIGEISFGLYLWQIPVFRLIGRHGMFLPASIRMILALGLTFGLSAVSWVMIERPAMRSRIARRLSGSKPRAATEISLSTQAG